MHEIEPLCVLDFYVHESCQRKGLGFALFRHMLEHQDVRPARLGYDRPSPKLLSFLAKYYGLKNYVPQTNNFVVFKKYFETAASRGGDDLQRPLSGSRASARSGHARFLDDDEPHSPSRASPGGPSVASYAVSSPSKHRGSPSSPASYGRRSTRMDRSQVDMDPPQRAPPPEKDPSYPNYGRRAMAVRGLDRGSAAGVLPGGGHRDEVPFRRPRDETPQAPLLGGIDDSARYSTSYGSSYAAPLGLDGVGVTPSHVIEQRVRSAMASKHVLSTRPW